MRSRINWLTCNSCAHYSINRSLVRKSTFFGIPQLGDAKSMSDGETERCYRILRPNGDVVQ